MVKNKIVLGPLDRNHAKRNDITLHVLFGVPKPDGSTIPILNLSDEHYLIILLIIQYTLNYAQMNVPKQNKL